jgi:hypothetical protein
MTKLGVWWLIYVAIFNCLIQIDVVLSWLEGKSREPLSALQWLGIEAGIFAVSIVLALLSWWQEIRGNRPN